MYLEYWSCWKVLGSKLPPELVLMVHTWLLKEYRKAVKTTMENLLHGIYPRNVKMIGPNWSLWAYAHVHHPLEMYVYYRDTHVWMIIDVVGSHGVKATYTCFDYTSGHTVLYRWYGLQRFYSVW